MLRGDGRVGHDGLRDVDLLVPGSAADWVEREFGARRAELESRALAGGPASDGATGPAAGAVDRAGPAR
jgi:hypothetical protein